MRLSRIEVEKIARAVVKQLNSAGVSLSDEERASTTIANLINDNMEAEKRLEEDAMKLLKKHSQAMGASLDEDKALRMIKRKLAEERKFVL